MDVKKLRKAKKLTQQGLADLADIPRDRIAKWEQGLGKPKADDLDKLKEIFLGNKREEVPNETRTVSKDTENSEIQTDPNIGDVMDETDRPNFNAQAILNLTEAERQRAISDRIRSENEQLREKNQSRLIGLIEISSAADAHTLKELGETVSALRKYTVGLASELRKQSEIEATQHLNTLVKSADAEVESKGTHTGVHK